MRAGARRISGTSDDLKISAERLLERALGLGADEAEVFGVWSRNLTLELRRDRVESISASVLRGLGLRAIIKGGVGFSSTSDLSRIDDVAEAAVSAARIFGPDRLWRGLPGKSRMPSVDGVFDRRIADVQTDTLLEISEELLGGCGAVGGVEPVSGGVSCTHSLEILINSSGLDLSEEGTSIHLALETIARGSSGVATGSEFDNSRSFSVNARAVGEKAADLARRSLDGISIETDTYDVVLSPVAFAELLESTFIPSLSAENVQKGRSTLAGMLNKSVSDLRLQVVDDGALPAGMGSSAFDGEGVPSQRNVLLEDGVLRSYLYDSYTAGKEGRSSTGNSVRSGYSEMPRIGIRNLIISSKEPVEMLDGVREGVLVNSVIGAHTANPISGDFSVEARNSFRIRAGEIAEPVRSAMIAGNIFDLLKHIDVGRDARAVGPIVTPGVRVRMRVVC
ncbi:MAG: TldD/PmbA family protein [Methanothrix sp.]|uniref:Peptidase U62, modulator of DNA gyrase n=1 Tax=Methanothrix thermoacetophila (strain DSM 6194 / JCM 14653 / NBRC 101360 / PT) TaxID=349307 RepID=A0B681_METTP|nr:MULTISPECIES: TldD/PmbA family protein [Methanothrix]ABK14205.1 peptidase U62, modulator of DNA gyrase [Methanothrix thermoacetophila PT]MBC7079696.1 TldD/PmbA family protein [Methanothrix sp.]NPU87771.1 TldD/PmbA family protein [Methanothrix sp.]